MMLVMETIVLIGAGKSASCLIEYLEIQSHKNGWIFIVADANIELAKSKVKSPNTIVVQLNIEAIEERRDLIRRASVVISMMPPHLHVQIAEDCVDLEKHLLTASYTDEKIKLLANKIKTRQLFFLCEMGLDPGIDHMSAMKIIDEIKAAGGKITTFRSHCGGLVAPESDNNPWHYKISWNPRNIVMAGKAGAVYLENGESITKDYKDLFDAKNRVLIPGLGELGWYPNRDSLSYMPLYQLEKVSNFIRTTLRYPSFNKGWKQLIDWNFTDESIKYDSNSVTVKSFTKKHLANFDIENEFHAVLSSNAKDPLLKELINYLDLLEDDRLPMKGAFTALDYMQFVLETKWKLEQFDKDMIVMLHEFEYELNGSTHRLTSSLVVKGKDPVMTAMAKTVGLPLGIAAVMLLQQKIALRGLYIPTVPEIYLPVLAELEKEGIIFEEQHSIR